MKFKFLGPKNTK